MRILLFKGKFLQCFSCREKLCPETFFLEEDKEKKEHRREEKGANIFFPPSSLCSLSFFLVPSGTLDIQTKQRGRKRKLFALMIMPTIISV